MPSVHAATVDGPVALYYLPYAHTGWVRQLELIGPFAGVREGPCKPAQSGEAQMGADAELLWQWSEGVLNRLLPHSE